MERREFIVTHALALLAAPLAAEAQQAGRVWRIGYLAPSGPDRSNFEAFREGLRDLGYAEGSNVTIVFRSGEADFARLKALAAELATSRVDVIVAGGTEGVAAARHATATIPIVMRIAADPVASGFVASLARPGGNITGLSGLEHGLYAKRLELLKEAVPKIARPAVLWNPTHPAHADGLKELEAAGRRLGVQVHGYPVNSAGEIDEAFAAMRRARSDGLVVLGSGLHLLHLRQIAAGALKLRVPAICFFRQFVNVDGLMAYGVDERDLARRAATYVDKILKGSKPGDLPVEQATKFELVINLKAAKALGLTIPPSVLGRADQVIE